MLLSIDYVSFDIFSIEYKNIFIFYQNWQYFTIFYWFCPSWWPNISVSVNFQNHVLLWFLISMKLSFKEALTDYFFDNFEIFRTERVPFWILHGREADFSSLMPNWYFFNDSSHCVGTNIEPCPISKKGTSLHPNNIFKTWKFIR